MSQSSSGARAALGGVLVVLCGATYVVASGGVWFFASLNGSELAGGDGGSDTTGTLLTMAGLGLLVVASAAIASGTRGAWRAGMSVAVLNGLAAVAMADPAALLYLVVIATMLVARAESLVRPDGG